jgi:uncharacterized protein YbjT (DUF2867 family)
MNVLVFGTADHTSRAVVAEMLAADHEVTAVFPPGTRVAPPHERLNVVDGHVTDPSVVDEAVEGKDAVVSVVGVTSRRPTTLYSEAAANIVEALEGGEPRRVVCLSSSRIDADGPGLSLARRIYTNLIIHRRYRNVLNDMARMEHELRLSDLDWTMIRPATVIPGRARGVHRTAVGGHVPPGRAVTTGDLGRYLATHLDDPATHRAVVEIAA